MLGTYGTSMHSQHDGLRLHFARYAFIKDNVFGFGPVESSSHSLTETSVCHIAVLTSPEENLASDIVSPNPYQLRFTYAT